MNVLEINVLVLAYLGDTIYENYIRRFLINSGIGNVNDLQKNATNYVSAVNQAKFLTEMIEARKYWNGSFKAMKDSNLQSRILNLVKIFFKDEDRDFPGHPVVRTPDFHCQGPRFNPW